MMEAINLTEQTVTTISEIVNIALEHIPMTFSNSDLTPGRKVYFPIPMTTEPEGADDFIYIYAESKLTYPPMDINAGFTEHDVVDETGVYIFKKIGKISVIGYTYSIETFLKEVIHDSSLQNRIIFKVGEMRNIVHLDDNFLDIANSEWINHKAEPEVFGFKRLH